MTEWLTCDVCGVPANCRPVSVTFGRHDDTEALCDLCEGLVRAGLLRRENVEGRVRYRQYVPQPMKRGKLLPGPNT